MKREWKRTNLSVAFASLALISCVKTKFRSNTPDSTAKPGIPAGKSPDETDPNKSVGDAPSVPAPYVPGSGPGTQPVPNPYNPQPAPNPYNPQPVVTSTPLPPIGQLPPKVVELPGLGGKPVQTIPPKWEPAPLPSIPPDKVLLQLRVVQLNYEAWWKNCLIVSVAGDSKAVGCNKTTALNTTVNLLANKGVCNRLDIRVQTYFPQDGACTPNAVCNGPYNSSVGLDRTAGDIYSAPFFKAYDRNNIMSRDPLIAISDSTSAIKAQMDAFAGSMPNNRWVRVYFEDQRKENLDAVLANPSSMALRVERGIDFNDYVFDIRGEGVEYYINGLEPMNCTRK